MPTHQDNRPTGHDDDDPMYSRGVSTLGKIIEVFKAHLPGDAARDYEVYCARLGTKPSDDLRNYIFSRLYGKSYDRLRREIEDHELNDTDARFADLGPSAGQSRAANTEPAPLRSVGGQQ